jgi:hypothetical protein
VVGGHLCALLGPVVVSLSLVPMGVVYTVACGVKECGARDSMRWVYYPGAEAMKWYPTDWRYIDGLVICPKHSVRVE